MKKTKTTYPKLTSLKCYECGSFLLLVSQKTELEEGQYAPVTTSTYECSDKVCQKETEKKRAQRRKKYEEQERAKEKKLMIMRANRKKKFESYAASKRA